MYNDYIIHVSLSSQVSVSKAKSCIMFRKGLPALCVTVVRKMNTKGQYCMLNLFIFIGTKQL